MKFPRNSLVLFCLLFCTLALANRDTPQVTEPAQALSTTAVSTAEKTNSTPKSAAQSRGQLLYENHCTKCHESQVHIRSGKKAKTIADVQGWVTKWQGNEKLHWSREDINDVTRYLVEHFYQFQ